MDRLPDPLELEPDLHTTEIITSTHPPCHVISPLQGGLVMGAISSFHHPSLILALERKMWDSLIGK
jgi:hypothetical protein